MRIAIFFSLLLAGVVAMSAQIADVPVEILDSVPDSTLVDRINQSGTIEIVAPVALNARLVNAGGENRVKAEVTSGSVVRSAGYRVQVFSDNNARTAKDEATRIADKISARFPEHRTYVVYNSPFWRLRVGDFRTRKDADDFAEQLKTAFPSYRREIRIVRDRITYTK